MSIKPRPRLTTEELKKKLEFEARMLEQKDQVLREMRETQRVIHEQAKEKKKQIKINNVEMNLEDLDLRKLTKEQAKDIHEIEELQKHIEHMSGNLSLRDVSLLDAKLNLRASYKSSGSHGRKNLAGLQNEIDKYQKEIQLMKLKLQFKQQLI